MRKQSAIDPRLSAFTTSPSEILTVLSISPLDEDQLELLPIFGHSSWILFTARNIRSALALLEERDISVVLCERDLRPGKYTEVLEHLKALPNSPSMIVASRVADDRLWAEALNLGAWDVLAKPLIRTETIRSIKSGWQHWHDQRARPAKTGRQQVEARG